MNPPRDDPYEDVIDLHEEACMSPPEIARRLGLPYHAVISILETYYAGRRAYADAVRLSELSPLQRRIVRVEACGHVADPTTHTAAPAGRRAA